MSERATLRVVNVQKNKKRNTRLNTSQLLYRYVQVYYIHTYKHIHFSCYIVGSLSPSRSQSSAQFGTGVLGLRVPLKAAKWAAAAVAVGGPLWSPRPMDPHDYDACDGSARLVYLYVFLAVPDCYRRL